jgi:hypothetical protein
MDNARTTPALILFAARSDPGWHEVEINDLRQCFIFRIGNSLHFDAAMEKRPGLD